MFKEKQGLYDPQFEHDSCGVGFLCNIKGRSSHSIVADSLKILKRLAHRGAVGADPETGDGAGILIQIPHDFFLKAADKSGIALPARGEYGTGLVFLPRDEEEALFCRNLSRKIVEDSGRILIGWRRVAVNNSAIGVTARNSEPLIEQIFIGKNGKIEDELHFERALYVIRKKIENGIRSSGIKQKSFFYITSLSSRTFSYKGLFMPHQVEEFFPELKDPDMKSSIGLVHSRYSTNTFPAWNLAQPFRFLAHNGEINTLRGNINWMRAREALLESELFGKDAVNLKPVIVPEGSDSASLDNAFELLVLGGRSLPHAMMMLIPGAWENNKGLSREIRDFYQYHACFMEAWDGPAAIAFTDGIRVGAVLDRNGLRPARYLATKDDRIIMASEVGVLDTKPQDILHSGRLEPGKIFFIDTEEGRVIQDDEVKEQMARRKPYGSWLGSNLTRLETLPEVPIIREETETLLTLQKAFGYTREDIKFILRPMAETGNEPVGSMGNDTPHAVLSKNSQLLYNYFKQLFAQVTNPAIDPIREELVMTLQTYVGPQRNVLDETAEHAHKLVLEEPVLTDGELERIRKIDVKGFRAKTLSVLFDPEAEKNLAAVLNRICAEADEALRQGSSFIILSDRGVSREKAAVPALLAAGAVHHHLVRSAVRTQIGIIAESGEPREVHHFALLFGYGVDCVNPYLAYDTIKDMARDGECDAPPDKAVKNYIKAVHKGVLKILSKMGISTLQSYRGSQIFEAVGLGEEVVEKCFAGTVSRIGGAGLSEIREETLLRHASAFPDRVSAPPSLPSGGVYQWKRDGEFHLWNPESIALLQDSVRKNDYEKYREFAALINDQSLNPATLRSLLKFKECRPVPLEEAEPAEEIFKRFVTGAMSFGSISRSAHETLAIAMNRLKGKSNTGEGGEDPARFAPLPNGDSASSAIKQVASGRFGVTTHYLVNARELQIKISQGAKPGEGGQLPGHKVSAIIAKTRYTTPGVTLISPPPHHDIYSIEDLAQLIFDLKSVNSSARISVKLVSETGVGTIAAGVAKGHADMILISGGDGGTGASPLGSIKHAGLPWELGLSETHQTLILNDLRSRVRLQTDGQMRTGRDVALAALLGAEEFGFCTAALIVLGCVMLRHCHLNNCSLGIATQSELLQRRFQGRPEYIENYFHFIVRELREIMASLGFRKIDEMIGRTDVLEMNGGILPWKAKKLDFSKLLYKPDVPESVGTICSRSQDHGIEDVFDRKLIQLAAPALKKGKQVRKELTIRNSDRTVGAMLSGELAKNYGEEGLPEDTINLKFKGVAGQSFGAFLMKGITFELEGMTNDYAGKGMFGGKLIIYPGKEATYKSEENIIIGNTSFYGAIRGEAYVRGIAGERFCIRNSGLFAVVEGVGDHGCEYMTGGRVVVLGKTGRNFAAGMSGGIAYVYDRDKTFKEKCNLEMVELTGPSDDDIGFINNLISNHYKFTKSVVALEILDNFNEYLKYIIKIFPLEYKHILEQKKIEENLDLLEVSD